MSHTILPVFLFATPVQRCIMAREDDSDTEPLAGDGDSGVFKVPREVADRRASRGLEVTTTFGG